MFGPSLRNLIRRWVARQELRSQLWAMDERQLSDIGITRAQIEDVVSGRLTRDADAGERKSDFERAA